jgi:hypothetical protein
MRRNQIFAGVLVLSAAVAGCGGRMGASTRARLQQVAVLARVDGGPTVVLDPASVPGRDATELAATLARAMRETVGHAELAQSLRDTVARLCGEAGVPVADPVRVATALGAYLVEEGPELRDYGALAELGIDGAIELALVDYGVTDPGPPRKPGYFAVVEAWFIRVTPGEKGDRQWSGSVRVDGGESGRHRIDVDGLLAQPGPSFRLGFAPALAEASEDVLVAMGLTSGRP